MYTHTWSLLAVRGILLKFWKKQLEWRLLDTILRLLSVSGSSVKVISRSSSTDDNLIVRSERIRSLDKLDGRVGYTSYILGSQAKNPSSFFDAVFFSSLGSRRLRFLSGTRTSRILVFHFSLEKLQDKRRPKSLKSWILTFLGAKPKAVVFYSPENLTCPLKNSGWKATFLLKWSLFSGHVNFRG